MGRCYGHDYRGRCIYHITLKKAPGVEDFGRLCGRSPEVGIARSPLGSAIERNIRRMPSLDRALRVLQYCIMPDHVHLLLFVTDTTKEHLGNYIGMLKVSVHQEYRDITCRDVTVFQPDFYDCILYRSRPLNAIYDYIRDNPRRLAVRRAHPDFFRRVSALKVGDKTYQAYGNIQLLDCPFREQVVVHRADTEAIRERNRRQWLHTAANGGVLVSPFISQDERAIRAEAEAVGGRFILILNDPFGERYKPAAHDFALCEAGRLLILSAGLPGDLTRPVCLAMNSLAAEICG